MRERKIFRGDGWTARVRLFPDRDNPNRSTVMHELAAGTSGWQLVSRRMQDHEAARSEYDALIETYENPTTEGPPS